MTAPGVFTPYSTIAPLLGALPGWVDAVDKERIASYQKYEEIYWSSESGFDAVMRGDNDSPVLMPSARTIVNTVNRYTAPEFNYRVEGTDTTANTVAQMAFAKLFTREEFFSKFNSNKLYGQIRGDWLWHVVANPAKPLGQRLSIYAVDPASYFPVYSEEEPERIVAVHLAEQVTFGGQPAVSRLTYRKVIDEETKATLGITREHGIFKPDKWWLATKPEATILPLEDLDPRITFIPVWHLKNFDANAPFGSSLLRGLESVMLGINQATSDEDMTLALEGLGVYATDGDAPVDESGNEVDWIMGPARVLTKANGLRRITGASSFLNTYGAHIDRLWSAAKESVGASDVAVGAPGPGVESGIALQIRLGPILAYTAVQDQHIIDKHKQFFHDLQFLFEVYDELPMLTQVEGLWTPKSTVVPTIGKKVPVNLTEVITQVVALRNCVPPVISLRSSHDLLRAAGMNLPDDELDVLAEEALGAVDPLAEPLPDDELGDDARIAGELV